MASHEEEVKWRRIVDSAENNIIEVTEEESSETGVGCQVKIDTTDMEAQTDLKLMESHTQMSSELSLLRSRIRDF